MSASNECRANRKPPFSDIDRERIRTEQREHNARAIKQHALESPLRVTVPPALVRSVDFWSGDAPAISRGLAALDSLSTLIASSNLSGIAIEKSDIWIHEARAALARFTSPWGSA